jgi:uncharacterized membrane protein
LHKRLFLLVRLSRLLWLRAALGAVLAVAAALLAPMLAPLAPDLLVNAISDEAGEEILKVIASSMLAVATFSLATMVAASSAITASASPRAANLMLDDRGAHNAISTFIGAFIFSIVGLIALGTTFYTAQSKFILFMITLAVLTLVVFTLLAWVGRLATIGRVGEAIDRVETATRDALRHRTPFLDGLPAVEIPQGCSPIHGQAVGYVQYVDVERLQAIARRMDLRVHLSVLPGAFLYRSTPLMFVEGRIDPQVRTELISAVVTAGSRTFEQDPRFGLVVLAEVASRALSPAVNDPGTAIDVVGTATRLLSVWGEAHWEAQADQPCDRVYVPALSAADLFEDVFRPIARDGAGIAEVGVALQKAFQELARSEAAGFREAALTQSQRALRQAEDRLILQDEIDQLRTLAQRVTAAA